MLEVISTGDLVAMLVLEIEAEVSNDPHEGWEILAQFTRVGKLHHTGRSKLDVLCEVHDQVQVVQRVLVDRPHTVVHKR